MPNTNGSNRENLIFTYGGVAPGAIDSGEAKWPTGFYGGPPVEQNDRMFSKFVHYFQIVFDKNNRDISPAESSNHGDGLARFHGVEACHDFVEQQKRCISCHCPSNFKALSPSEGEVASHRLCAVAQLHRFKDFMGPFGCRVAPSVYCEGTNHDVLNNGQ